MQAAPLSSVFGAPTSSGVTDTRQDHIRAGLMPMLSLEIGVRPSEVKFL